jgi:hypothetical protein
MLGILQLLGWFFESKIMPPEDIFNELYLDCKEQKRVINELWDNFLYLKEIESKDVKKPDKNATKS